jgi:hypothetical protein
MTDEQAQKAIDFIRDNASKYAEAKGNRVYIENFLKSKKATLMAEEAGTLGAKEMYAYAHPQYVELLVGLQSAVQIEETIKWEMEAAKLRFEHYKTISFNNRVEARTMS